MNTSSSIRACLAFWYAEKVKPGHHRTQKIVAVSMCALLASSIASAAQNEEKSPSSRAKPPLVRWEPARLVNGSPFLLRVRPPVRLKSLTGAWLGHEVFFGYNPGSKTWIRSEERRVGKGRSASVASAQAEDGIRDTSVTGVQTCALPI